MWGGGSSCLLVYTELAGRKGTCKRSLQVGDNLQLTATGEEGVSFQLGNI